MRRRYIPPRRPIRAQPQDPAPARVHARQRRAYLRVGIATPFRRAAGRWGAVRTAVNEDSTMPKNKDVKRLVRARMAKTGEAYTTARMHVLARRRAPAANGTTANGAAPTPPAAAAPPDDFATLAGMRDAAIEAKTGCNWERWVFALDKLGAMGMTHTELAEFVHARYSIPGWWSQAVAVGYERIRGKRSKNQVASGFAVSKSKTFALPVAQLVRALAPRTRSQWLDAPAGKARRSRNPHVVRWQDGDRTFVDVYLLSKGSKKTTVNVQHTRLRSSADVDDRRALWALRLDALGAWLAQRRT